MESLFLALYSIFSDDIPLMLLFIFCFWSFKQHTATKDKLDKVYSKQETKELVNIALTEVKHSINMLSSVVERMDKSINKLDESIDHIKDRLPPKN